MNALDESNPNQPGDLVIFDGVCNLCEASVNFIMRHDKDGVFRFVPSQSELGGVLQRQYQIDTAGRDTVVLIRDGQVFTESDAAVRIAAGFDGGWRLLGLARWVPRPVRDWAYRRIANNRYAWFGRKEVCMMPTPELRGRFLESSADLHGVDRGG
ncbi:MAG: thiol-disulfide oxidoreductase DCC family protein [Candidatus Promineofilum sp.]|nr:thiol-disulfide oxidoreductase DCC family protein [Promineifilum sp.]